LATNATLSGKKLLAKIVNEVKQPTVFCPFERLIVLRYSEDFSRVANLCNTTKEITTESPAKKP